MKESRRVLEEGIVQFAGYVEGSKGRIDAIKSDIVRLKKEAYMRNAEQSPIFYSPWFDGIWKSVDVRYAACPNRENSEYADSLVGKIYDFSIPWEIEVVGGTVPILDHEQYFFFEACFSYYLWELGLEGNYYTIVRFSEGEFPCCVIKSKNEMLIAELNTGVYTAVRVDDKKESKNVYDPTLTFEENIEKRMELQGIEHFYYYGDIGEGYWIIEEVIYAENMREAEKHLGKIVDYNVVDKFDLEFFDSSQSRIFYDMPTVEELGISGKYYLINWEDNTEYRASIVKSEQEIYFIKGNMILRASRMEDESDRTILYAG